MKGNRVDTMWERARTAIHRLAETQSASSPTAALATAQTPEISVPCKPTFPCRYSGLANSAPMIHTTVRQAAMGARQVASVQPQLFSRRS
jgi:hypothetical protein